jgi:hypothetical protein
MAMTFAVVEAARFLMALLSLYDLHIGVNCVLSLLRKDRTVLGGFHPISSKVKEGSEYSLGSWRNEVSTTKLGMLKELTFQQPDWVCWRNRSSINQIGYVVETEVPTTRLGMLKEPKFQQPAWVCWRNRSSNNQLGYVEGTEVPTTTGFYGITVR